MKTARLVDESECNELHEDKTSPRAVCHEVSGRG